MLLLPDGSTHDHSHSYSQQLFCLPAKKKVPFGTTIYGVNDLFFKLYHKFEAKSKVTGFGVMRYLEAGPKTWTGPNKSLVALSGRFREVLFELIFFAIMLFGICHCITFDRDVWPR